MIGTDELKALLEKATDGRWESMATADLSLFVVRDGNDGEELIAQVETCNPHDASLLALAPTLAARVVALEEVVKAADVLAKEMFDQAFIHAIRLGYARDYGSDDEVKAIEWDMDKAKAAHATYQGCRAELEERG